MRYSECEIEELSEQYSKWTDRGETLIERILTHAFKKEPSRTLAAHGLARRLMTLARCMERVYRIIPLDAENPAIDEIQDASIFLQAFVVNVYGSIDNLARLWVWEAEVTKSNGGRLPQKWIGLKPSCRHVRQSLPSSFQKYLNNANLWFKYLENYRHALAHRIPLYIPTQCLDQVSSGPYEPLMMHSFGSAEEDGWPVRFHPQMVCDFATVVELSEKMMTELEALPRD